MLSRSQVIFCSLAKHLYFCVFLTDCTFPFWIGLLLLYKYYIKEKTVVYRIHFILRDYIFPKNGYITKSLRFDGISVVIPFCVMSIPYQPFKRLGVLQYTHPWISTLSSRYFTTSLIWSCRFLRSCSKPGKGTHGERRPGEMIDGILFEFHGPWKKSSRTHTELLL